MTWYSAVPAMLMVVPSGITKRETPFCTPSASSAVRMVSGITAAELDVENASSNTSRLPRKNASGERRRPTAYTSIRNANASSKAPSTVTTYTPMPSSASSPMRAVSWVISPNTAAGTRYMAQRTTTMLTSCTAPSRSTSGRANLPSIVTSATPTQMANTTTCSMFCSTLACKGLVGTTRTICAGNVDKDGAVAEADTSAVVLAGNWAACRYAPGSTASATSTPIEAATTVVNRKNRPVRTPKLRNCAMSRELVMPRMIDATTSGMTIICTMARNR